MSADYASTGVEELWQRWNDAKARQWNKGRNEHRREINEPFRGNAASEAASEAADFSNYADQLYQEGRIKAEEREAWEAKMFEAFIWCERIRQEEEHGVP